MFVGEFDRSVDGAGRIALPADFRDLLVPKCFVTYDPDGFVKVTTEAWFRAESDFLREEIRAGRRPASALRAFGTRTQVLSVDKQGRITLDETTRRSAGIQGQAIIAGAVDHLEIWRPSRFRQVGSEHEVVAPSRIWIDEDDDA